MSKVAKAIQLAVFMMCAVLVPTVCNAQFGSGTLNGTVLDATGASIPGALVEFLNVETNTKKSVRADAQGRYSEPELSIGKYRVSASAGGFGEQSKDGVEVSVGVQLTVDFALKPGNVTSSVTVDASAQAQVNTTSAEQSTLVDQRQMRDLPLNGRNFEQLILLAPGVHAAPASQSGAFYGRSSAYSISGTRPEGQLVLIDGANVTGYYNRGTGASIIGTSLGVEAISEFQTIVGIYGAQFGGDGGVINAVTRSGTNQVHGSLYDFVRNSVFDARTLNDPISGPPSFRRNQFGGSIGFPIQKDKTFLFLNYEGLRQQLGENNSTIVPDANAHAGLLPCAIAGAAYACGTNGLAVVGVKANIAPLLNLLPLPNAGLIAGSGAGNYVSVGDKPANEDYVHGRIDRNFGQKDTASVRYISDNGALIDPFSTFTIQGFPEVSIQRNRFLTLEDKHIISSTFLDTARFHFTRTSQAAHQQYQNPVNSPYQFVPGRQYGTYVISSLSPSGLPSNGFGSNLLTPLRFTQNKFAFQDDVYLTVKSHQIETGIDVTRVQSNTFIDYYAAGDYTFPSLLTYLTGAPSLVLVAQAGSDSHRSGRELDITPYIQDDWKATSKLSLNLGLRYAFVTNPVEKNNKYAAILDLATSTGFTPVPHAFASNPSLKNLDPRFGFSYTPVTGTAIRGGFGIFHDVLGARSYQGFYNLSPPYSIVSILNPSFPNVFASGSPGAPSLTSAMLYINKNTPYQMQSSLGVQQQIGKHLVFSIAYVGNEGRHLLNARDINPPVAQICPCTDAANPAAANLPAGTHYFPTPVRGYVRLNTHFGALNYNPTSGTSHYHSLQTSLEQKFSHGLQFQAAYTFSKVMDYGSITLGNEEVNGSNVVMDPYNVKGDYGPAAFDITNVASANLLYALPVKGQNRLLTGWQASLVGQAHSGSPYNAILGFDRANLNNSLDNVRPNLVGNPNQAGPVAANPTCAAPATIHNTQHYYNPCAFQLEPAGTVGNTPRDLLRAPGLQNLDVGLFKDTSFPRLSEAFKVQLRAELFNVLNHTNLGFPNFVTLTAAGMNPAAGQIVSAQTPARQVQFTVKFLF